MLKTKIIDNVKHYCMHDVYSHIFRDDVACLINKYTSYNKLFEYLVGYKFEPKYKPRAHELLEWLKHD
jgi:hypothetical protein